MAQLSLQQNIGNILNQGMLCKLRRKSSCSPMAIHNHYKETT